MKKTLLLIMTIVLCTTVMAQHKTKISKDRAVLLNKNAYCYGTEKEAEGFIPIVSRTILQKGDYLDPVGETHYNSPTNAFSRNTVSFEPNTRNVGVVWTTAPGGNPSSPGRGTGINYFKNGWGPVPDAADRIETLRSGWGTHGFTEEGEIVVSHSALVSLDAGIYVMTREKWGEGEWDQYTLNGPEYQIHDGNTLKESTGILWPTLVTNGNVVHMVCVTDQFPKAGDRPDEYDYGYKPDGVHNFATVPLYYRSTDGGKTWDIKAHDFRGEGMKDYEVHTTSGDNYILAVKGDHVVYLYAPNAGLHYMESKDGGNTWTKKTILDNGEFSYPGTTPREYYLAPEAGTIYIDENDKVHVAFSSHCVLIDENDGGYKYLPEMPIGLIYWNDERDPIKPEDVKGEVVGEYFYTLWENYRGYIPLPSVLGFDEFGEWDGDDAPAPAYLWDQFRGSLFAYSPRIIAKDGRVYISFQSILENPLIYKGDLENFYRGIFVTVSEDGGETWDVPNNTSWVSYHPDIFFCEWGNYSGPQYDNQGEPYWDGTITMSQRTENGYPTMSTNLYGNLFIIQWYNHVEPFWGGTATIIQSPISVFTLALSLKDFPKYANISEVWQGLWQDIESFESDGDGNGIFEPKPTIKAEIYPNPATDKVYVKVNANAPYTVTVTNIMGQVMHTANNATTINVSNFTPGVYIVNVKTPNATTSQKLIVK